MNATQSPVESGPHELRDKAAAMALLQRLLAHDVPPFFRVQEIHARPELVEAIADADDSVLQAFAAWWGDREGLAAHLRAAEPPAALAGFAAGVDAALAAATRVELGERGAS